MKHLLLIVALVTALTTIVNFGSTATVKEILKVEGGLISGLEADGIRIYKGIPFAAPPVGELRWKAPQPVIPWSGVKECTAFGAECPQAPYPAGSLYYRDPQPMSEDCLFLNVWTAAKAGEKKPVMVWIHGGALTRGSGSASVYDGTNLAKQGVVLVTINYRLGPLGYLAHPELTQESPQHSSGNYGVLDQIAALKWVKKNIEAFGGDPGNVTIFGESAGSWSVNILVATPLAKGLFHRAIGESGATFGTSYTLKEAEKSGQAFAKAGGASSLKEMRAVSAEKLIQFFDKDPEGRKFTTSTNVDGWVLPKSTREIFAEKKHNDVPVILGSNANEMTTLTVPATIPKSLTTYRKLVATLFGDLAEEHAKLYPANSDAEVRDAYLSSSRDLTFTWGMRTWARATVAGKSKAYLYYFNHVPPNPASKLLGAYHAAEIVYVFGNLNQQRALEEDKQVSKALMGYWVNFAKTGNLNGKGLPEWKPYDKANEPYLDISSPPQTKNHLLKPQLDFVEKYYAMKANPGAVSMR